MARKFTDEEYVKLRTAERLLADVQCTIAQADLPDEKKEDWQKLYHIRCDLGQEVHNRRPDNWPALEVSMKG